ncbi:MAG: discoidin domain-containing protein, partial [Thermoguttaceae bacterium]|nr:discoidin domain-containing protein [Thermoguttaceae bacterium]MDW8039728.1 discoidin domain-containing protein [Thermoguttaceae bacterium]
MQSVALIWAVAWIPAAVEPAELKMDIWPDRANTVQFPAQEARFVRLVIHGTSGQEPCIDELELYGPDGPENLALATAGAKATASSLLPGYPQHQIEHLNDGRYGNASSWIPAGQAGEWAQIELPRPAKLNRVVISRDREGQYADRIPTHFEVQLSLDGKTWQTAAKVAGRAVGPARRAQPGGFIGVVGPAPPPPRMAPGKTGLEVQPAADLQAPKKDELGFENLAIRPGAKVNASSLLPGYAIHQIAHLNDGKLGNSHSWISRGEPSWAEIDLGELFWVYKVAFGSDSSGQYQDRAPRQFAILAAREYQADSAASTWQVVYKADGSPVHVRREFKFPPVQARWIRLQIQSAAGGEARIDELEIYGQKEPIPLEKIGPLPGQLVAETLPEETELVRYAFLSEEHAWLKTFGRADLDPSLVPYNGRVKEYPRHVGDDRLPLPPLSTAPKLDGQLDEPCWQEASRGVARVADLADFGQSPLVETAVWAGWKDEYLYLALQTDRLLSSHVAVVSSADGQGCGVVALEKEGLVFKTYRAEGPYQVQLDQTRPVEGGYDKALRRWEIRLPLAWFPECREQGLRIGLGMGGRHTAAIGRPVHFVFADLALAEQPPCLDRVFRVRVRVPAGGKPCRLQSQASGWPADLVLQPGQVQVV